MTDTFKHEAEYSLKAKLERGFSEAEALFSGSYFVCYADGSCDNVREPHVGGSAYVMLQNGNVVKSVSKGFVGTTNNRMEMLGIISAANACPEGSYVDIYSDSKYAVNVLGMKMGHSANSDLYDMFVKCADRLSGIRLFWVKGHSGNKWNEMADNLAYAAYADKCRELGIAVQESLVWNRR